MTKPHDFKHYTVDENGCWIYKGAQTHHGYGKCGATSSHRAYYEHYRGPIPKGMQLDHIVCDNTTCCNPWHMEPKSGRENTLRSLKNPTAINARKTHCPKGHEYTPENTYRSKHNDRQCRECHRLHSKAVAARLKATRHGIYALETKASL